MTLPSDEWGTTTTEVGFFDAGAETLARWLVAGFASEGDPGWEIVRPGWRSIGDAVTSLKPADHSTRRHAFVPLGTWTVLLNNTLSGTDVGVMPSYAARELGRRAIRAGIPGGDATSYGTILEVFGPDGKPPLASERSVAAANDGGRWVFETSGTPFPFEDLEAYKRRVKANRFTPEMLYDYLRALGVECDRDPDWPATWTVERR